MNEVLHFILALAAGLLLGAFFFGCLWRTVIGGVSSSRPALWFFAGMPIRMSITLAGFWVAGREDWQRWLLCLLGFVLARLVVKWLTHLPVEPHSPRAAKTSYAS